MSKRPNYARCSGIFRLQVFLLCGPTFNVALSPFQMCSGFLTAGTFSSCLHCVAAVTRQLANEQTEVEVLWGCCQTPCTNEMTSWTLCFGVNMGVPRAAEELNVVLLRNFLLGIYCWWRQNINESIVFPQFESQFGELNTGNDSQCESVCFCM